MAVSDEKAIELFDRLLDVCVAVAKDAHAFIGKNDLKRNPFLSSKYPGLSTSIFYDERYIEEEVREKVPFLKYRIPKYEMSQYPDDKKYYSAIFENYRSEYINIEKYSQIDEIKKWIETDTEVLKAFTNKEKLSDYLIRGFVKSVVERYLYKSNATEIVPKEIEDNLKPYVAERLLFYLEDVLYFDICVPVCLATFAENIKLDDNVEIISISDELQKARQIACKYEVTKEDWVAACATHMIVFHNYNYKKDESYSFNSVMQDYCCYPLETIDEVFGVIRVATGYQIGYEHIFCIPDGWVFDTETDVEAVYGAKSHFINPKFLKMDWMNLPVSYVTEEQCKEISELYLSYKENKTKLKFALSRYNRCALRDEVDDMTTDACIGLESLLAGGTHGEITYTISNRIPIVFSKIKNEKFSALSCRGYMKKIYDLRSKVVHGVSLSDKYLYITKEDEKIYVPEMAVEFLRTTLIFMIKNPDYLEPKKIDEYIDTLFENPE